MAISAAVSAHLCMAGNMAAAHQEETPALQVLQAAAGAADALWGADVGSKGYAGRR
jgi:hypothetical protein